MSNPAPEKATRRPAIPAAIDHAHICIFPEGDAMLVFSGWAALPEDWFLVILDENMADPRPVSFYFWPRGDVEKLYGPCLNPRQRGYGFIAHARCGRKQKINLTAVRDGKGITIAVIDPSRSYDMPGFLRAICAIPIPVSECANAWIGLLPFLESGFNEQEDLSRAMPLESIEPAMSADVPLVTLIIPMASDMETAFTQMLALSEDGFIRTEAELIYVSADAGAWDAAKIILREIRAVCGLTPRWLARNGAPGAASLLNVAAESARGQFLLFMPGNIIPPKESWLPKIIDLLASSPDFGAIGCVPANISGLSAGKIFQILPGAIPQICPLAPDICASGEHVGIISAPAVFGGAIIGAERNFFGQCGGFDGHYLEQSYASMDFCRRVRANSKKFLYRAMPGLVEIKRLTDHEDSACCHADLMRYLFAQIAESETVAANQG